MRRPAQTPVHPNARGANDAKVGFGSQFAEMAKIPALLTHPWVDRVGLAR
jgi:hypothetical protein